MTNSFSDRPLLLLIDSHALIYRAFYAFPPLTSKSGELVNAVYGFTRILLTVIRDLQPRYIATAFDLPKPTFRHTDFAGYKAQRKEMPAELQGQIQRVRDIVGALNIPLLAVEGYEADDVIGTIARQVEREDAQTAVMIVTGDRDAFQLVSDRVHVWMPVTNATQKHAAEYGPAEVLEKMGVSPSQIVDFKALSGDASDNIPGVKGIGAKTAVRLIQDFGSMDGVYDAIANSTTSQSSGVLKGAVVKKLAEGHQEAVMSKKLATIDTAVPISVTLDQCRVSGYDKTTAVELFESLGFSSLIKYLPLDDFESGVQDALF